MDKYSVFPDKPIVPSGVVSNRLLSLGIDTFHKACRYVHELSYGYNADRDDLMILFKEKMGTCTTKHAVIATLAAELDLPVEKNVGIYAMRSDRHRHRFDPQKVRLALRADDPLLSD